MSDPTLSEPEPERGQPEAQLGPRGPRVHFINDGVRFRHQPSHATSDYPHLARPSNQDASPQRFTNPFDRDELVPKNPTSNAALDGVTLYQTQLPLNGSGTLDLNRNHLELCQGDYAELSSTRDRYLWSSHQHPYDIEPPSRVYNDATFGPRRLTVGSLDDSVGRGSAWSLPPRYSTQDPIDVSLPPMPRRFRGGFANMLELWRVYWQQAPDQSEFVIPGKALFGDAHSRPSLARSQSSFGYDPDDPKITGMKKASQEDPEDAESQCRQQMNLQYMSYRQRRKEAQKIKIQFNVTCNVLFPSSTHATDSSCHPWGIYLTTCLPRFSHSQPPAIHNETCSLSHGFRCPFAPNRVPTHCSCAHTRGRCRVYPSPKPHHRLLWRPRDKDLRDPLFAMQRPPRSREPSQGAPNLPPRGARRDECTQRNGRTRANTEWQADLWPLDKMLSRLLSLCADLSVGFWRLLLGHVRRRLRSLCAERIAAYRRHEELTICECL